MPLSYHSHGIYDGTLHVAEIMNTPDQAKYGKMFAAAPDLLAACECVLAGEPHARHDVIAALKKAKGE